MGDILVIAEAVFLYRGTTSDRLCGARMEYQARQLARGLSANCFLVDILEEYCNEPSRMRGRAGTMACGCGLPRGAKPPHVARGATVCTMAWGAGRCATGGTRRGSQGSAYGFSLGACWLVGVRRRAGSRVLLGAVPFARRGPLLATAR